MYSDSQSPTFGIGAKQKRPCIWRRPTLSWASVEGTAFLPNGGPDPDYSVVEAICTSKRLEEFGAVSDGLRILLGKILRVQWSPAPTSISSSDSIRDQPEFVLFNEGLDVPVNVSFDFY
jgi:hypothetical protein